MSAIEKIAKFLEINQVCFLATVDEGEAKVRPVAPMAFKDGKIWFSTSRQGNIYRQLTVHPTFQMFCLSPEMASARVTAKATFEDNREMKQYGLDTRPNLPQFFGNADNPDFVIFYVEHGKAEMRTSPMQAPDFFDF